MWQRTLKKLRTLIKKIQCALNLRPYQGTLKKTFQSALNLEPNCFQGAKFFKVRCNRPK